MLRNKIEVGALSSSPTTTAQVADLVDLELELELRPADEAATTEISSFFAFLLGDEKGDVSADCSNMVTQHRAALHRVPFPHKILSFSLSLSLSHYKAFTSLIDGII